MGGRRLGQHYLRDAWAIRRIVQAIAPAPGDRLVEIGPGLGAITGPLLDIAGEMDAVELDAGLIPRLRQRLAGRGALTIHHADALGIDLAAMRRDDRLLRLVGNLPYQISTPLLFRLLAQAGNIRDMHFMMQKDVVDRMDARPSAPAYGRLSVMVQYRCAVQPIFDLGPRAFSPPPRVSSTFVRLLPLQSPPVTVSDERRFEAIVRQAFSLRRKTLRNSLASMLAPGDIEAAGVDPGARPETLDLGAFAALSERPQ